MDLKPGYRELRPPDALRDVVGCIWMGVTETADQIRIVPDACTDVVWHQGEGTTVAGPDTTPKVVGRTPGDVLVGMRFLPGTAGGVLGVPLDALRDLRVDVAEVDRAFDVDGDLAPREVVARFMSAAAGTTSRSPRQDRLTGAGTRPSAPSTSWSARPRRRHSYA